MVSRALQIRRISNSIIGLAIGRSAPKVLVGVLTARLRYRSINVWWLRLGMAEEDIAGGISLGTARTTGAGMGCSPTMKAGFMCLPPVKSRPARLNLKVTVVEQTERPF